MYTREEGCKTLYNVNPKNGYPLVNKFKYNPRTKIYLKPQVRPLNF